MKRKQAFTLIELLVVVAIIALLLAILIPTLNRARESAKKSVCLAHLKQMGTAFYSYGGNNDGMVPDGGIVALSWNQQTQESNPTGVTAQINTWESELVVDGSVLEKFKQNGVLANTQFFAAGWGIFFCPSSLTSNRPDFPAKLEGTGANTNASYGMNYYAGSIWYLSANAGVTAPIPAGGSTDPKASNTSIAYFPHTMRTNFWVSSHIVVTEAFDQLAISGEPPSGDPATLNSPPSEAAIRALYGSRNGVWLRHSKGANYLMGDGHAEWSDKYHTYNSTNPTVNREYSADPTGTPPTATDSSIWGHNPYGIRGYYR